ncbi:glycosyltransferase family 4 protein [uncultured Pseudodesulfovibrio sp.]|uniref:glycosyltransferase family 4 protein n=1 Tax=uncultured Pseudodesulfovibrio sp. TaxID=2035858 RepID=UPI0029C8AB3C|nr:glycosyltransferase family 4 protein [uncultured Pseudodesulfovibrio sp.]
MKIALCTPFKPLDNPSVSGDVTIARDLVDTLGQLGHDIIVLPHFSAKKIYCRPGMWPGALLAVSRMEEAARGADCWLTFGSYYKVPDVFGPTATRRLGIPYFIVQASYAKNRGKKITTWPGYMLNKRAMLRADHIFCNRKNDVRGCSKLFSQSHYTPIRPGIPEGLLSQDSAAGARLRNSWATGNSVVIVTVAMMRSGVKEQGLRWMFDSCAELVAEGLDISLVVAGDGPCRVDLEARAKKLLGKRVRFLGKVDRHELGTVFSAGDMFAFPGIKESLGMVYLESQMCGLPVVATDDEGAPMVVAHGQTGLITKTNREDFTAGVRQLVSNPALRSELAARCAAYVREQHSAEINYQEMTRIMENIVRNGAGK